MTASVGHLRAVRLLRGLFALMLALLSGTAFASFPATQTTSGYTVTNWTTSGPVYGDQSTACVTGAPAAYHAAGGQDPSPTATWSGGSCTLNRSAYWGGALGITIGAAGVAYTCPSNSTLGGSSCTCNTGYSQNSSNNGCIAVSSAYCNSVSGQFGGPRVVQVSSVSGQVGTTKTYCVTGLGPLSDGTYASCSVSGTVTAAGGSTSSGGGYAWMDSTTYTGQTCNGSEAASGTGTQTTPSTTAQCSDPSSCPPPAGQCPGNLNGVAMWVPCGSNTTTATKTSQTTNPDGTQNKVTTGQQTTCGQDGTCTTTTTTTTTNITNGTSSTSTTTTTQSKSAYCAANASDAQCSGSGSGGGNGSSFGGSCSTGFTCSGDAAQCAAAKATWMTHCDLQVDPNSSEVQGYQTAKAATGPGLQSDTVTLGPSSFDQSDALGGAGGSSCIADRAVPFTVGHTVQQIVIPFSKVCAVAGLMGNFLVAFAFLVGTGIVLSGMKE